MLSKRSSTRYLFWQYVISGNACNNSFLANILRLHYIITIHLDTFPMFVLCICIKLDTVNPVIFPTVSEGRE
jgi:hypothetical protein